MITFFYILTKLILNKKGPALSGFIVTAIGFPSMLILIAIICFLYAPAIFLLKNPPAKEENIVRHEL